MADRDQHVQLQVVQPVVAARVGTRIYVEEYYAEDFMVDNHDYVYTVQVQ